MEIIASVIGGILALGGVWWANWLNNKNKESNNKKRINNLKIALHEELVSIRAQIPQKIDIVDQMIKALKNKQYLPGMGVNIINKVYYLNISELYPELTYEERNCLHVIYERLRVADEVLNNFESNFKLDHKEKLLKDVFKTYLDRLSSIKKSYEVVDKLIDDYLQGIVEDVFQIDLIKRKSN